MVSLLRKHASTENMIKQYSEFFSSNYKILFIKKKQKENFLNSDNIILTHLSSTELCSLIVLKHVDESILLFIELELLKNKALMVT